MLLRMLFCPIRPFFYRVGLLTLHLRHLTDRMLLTRRGKQSHRQENSEDALPNEISHNALAQLSVSRRPCKAKACWNTATAESFGYDREHEQEYEAVEEERVMIETRRCGITITRGGPHRKTQRMERSVRSRSAFCRHVAV